MTRDPERGKRIAAFRRAVQRSQRAVADEVGVSERTVQLWEAGGPLSWPNAVALARVLHTTPREIVDGVPEAAIVADEELRLRRVEAQVASAEDHVIVRLERLEVQIAALEEQIRNLALALQALVQAQPPHAIDGTAQSDDPAPDRLAAYGPQRR